jgi:hypothetical protein
MALEDLPLHEPAPPAPRPTGRASSGPSRWIVLGAVIVVAGSLLAMCWLSRLRVDPAPPTFANAPDGRASSPRPKSQGIDLPPLDASDELLRQIVSTLSSHPALARLLTTPALARNATLAVVQIGAGRTPSGPLKALRPSTHTSMVGAQSGPLDPRTYRRWDGPAAALVSLPPEGVAQIYVNIKPLLDQAYQELGHNDDFDRALVRAIETLTETPRLTNDPVLLEKPGYFEHEDPALKALLPVQRQFLLVGPDNQRRIVEWLRRLASSLDLNVR